MGINMENTRTQLVRFLVMTDPDDTDGREYVGLVQAEGGPVVEPPGFVRWVGDLQEVELQNGIPDSDDDAIH
jgi:hypothetical protein